MKVGLWNLGYIVAPIGVLVAVIIGKRRFYLKQVAGHEFKRIRYSESFVKVYATIAAAVYSVMVFLAVHFGGAARVILEYPEHPNDSFYLAIFMEVTFLLSIVAYRSCVLMTIERSEPNLQPNTRRIPKTVTEDGKSRIFLKDIFGALQELQIDISAETTAEDQELQIPDISHRVEMIRATAVAETAKPIPQPHGEEGTLYCSKGSQSMVFEPASNKIIDFRSRQANSARRHAQK